MRRPSVTREVVALGVTASFLATSGCWVAAARLEERFRNPLGISISHPRTQPVPGGWVEIVTSRSPTGAFLTVVRLRPGTWEDRTVLVVDAHLGTVAGRLPASTIGGFLGPLAWRDAETLWVSAVQFPDTCVSAFVARPPTWELALDDCSRPPPEVVVSMPRCGVLSPDGALRASARNDRTGPWDFGDAARSIPDVRIEDSRGRFLAQFSNLQLVGWTLDGGLIVEPDDDGRWHSISRAEIDRATNG